MNSPKSSKSSINMQEHNYKGINKSRFPTNKQKDIFTSTLDPYETQYKWWEKEHVKIACSYPPVMLRLNLLMGSCIARLTDRKYMLQLVTRLMQDYEICQQLRIQGNLEKERIRIKELVLKNVIPMKEVAEEMRGYPLFELHRYSTAVIRGLTKKEESKFHDHPSLYNLLFVGKETDDTHEEAVVAELDDVEIASKGEEHKDIAEGYAMTDEEFEAATYEDEKIKDLANLGNAGSIYSRVNEIVGILYSHVDEGRYQLHKEKHTVDKKAVLYNS